MSRGRVLQVDRLQQRRWWAGGFEAGSFCLLRDAETIDDRKSSHWGYTAEL